ncbi:MAG: CBS domain-containing protein [Firmicutes bacterium]|jgi:CBS domain-containing protein|nr:CBS domain-containing protein [Bacillota bacterium]
MRVRDIMTEDVTTVSEDATIGDAARLMAEKGIGGLPVTDAKGQVVGIITERDLLWRAKELRPPTFVPIMGAFIYLENPERFQRDLRKAISMVVGDVMTRGVITVDEDAGVEDVARIMVEKDINRVPVMKEGKLVGIVARADVVKAILGEEAGSRGDGDV